MAKLFTTGIYGYLDLVLIGWTLGLLWLGGCALFAKGGWKGRLHAALSDERLLFGGWAGDARTRVGSWAFAAAMALLQFDMFFMNSYVRETPAAWYGFLASKLEVVYFWLIILKLVFLTRYSGLQLGAGYCFFFVFRWVFLNNGQFWVVAGMMFFLAAKDVRLRQTLKIGLAVSAGSFLAVVAAAAMGWIGTLTLGGDLSGERARNSFGYGWFNLTGAILLAVCVMYVCWRQTRDLKWYDFALLAAALVFCDRGPDSRAATVCIALLILLSALLRFFPGAAKPVWVRGLVSAAPAAAFAASLLSGWFYSAESGFWTRLDSLFTNRLMLANEALTGSGIAIAGQRLTDAGFVVDNFYVAQWVYGGPVTSLLLWVAVTALLWRLMKKGAVTESACLVVMLAHAFMEGHFIWPCINVCLWLLPCVLYLLPRSRTPDFAKPIAD